MRKWEDIVEISEDVTTEKVAPYTPMEKVAPVSASNAMDEVAKAKQLFDARILTEQEFADLKAKLIAKL